MTAKEKANSIVDEYKNVEILNEILAIECAKIAIDHIIIAITKIEEDNGYGFGSDYWIEVKQELEKL